MANQFMCAILFIFWIPSISREVFAQRCPPGRFCPIGVNCTDNATRCVIMCATDGDHKQQGNHTTRNCERSKPYVCITERPSVVC